jgi:hypothetical protein
MLAAIYAAACVHCDLMLLKYDHIIAISFMKVNREFFPILEIYYYSLLIFFMVFRL